ncbi:MULTISPECIES: M13-type metalloendopeptidase [unclassified Duganella]|uniref:M13-type metalloendopeptidase n=1 Tax=unclassified Duganella TaxID=2636909 RepID=UPI000E350BB8|nr:MULTISPECIES: M13 family metallopeptidase [unclassified Duganella]RFP10026.1 M13 family peptidase [Duganella sp. BJB475]RFP25669.1 M13 family peptidase [Duganella sp. BJB476]
MKQHSLATALLALAAAGAHAASQPGDDFYRYVNDGWSATAVLPADAGAWTVYTQLNADNEARMAALYAAARDAADPAVRRVGIYYAAQMDTAGIEARGLAPLQPLLRQIAALGDAGALAGFLGAQLRTDVDPLNLGKTASENLFGLWVAPGLHDTTHYMPYLLQGGLGLPDRSFYLADNPGQKAVLAAYRDYVAAMLEQAGFADAAGRAARIVALETRIAGAQASPQASADLAQADQVWRRNQFADRAPGLDWAAYFDAAGLSAQQRFGVWQAGAVSAIAALVPATPLDVWRDYLSFHALNQSARFLPKALAERYFAFYDPLFLGPGEHLPLWRHAVNQTNTVVPGAGRLYSERYFSPRAQARVREIAVNVAAAFDRRIDQLNWMTPATRAEAHAKLRNLRIGVGHPGHWRGSDGLELRVDDAVGNALRAEAYNYRYEVARLGRAVDRDDWILGGELFGYNRMPLQNALTIPVVALQQPMFDADGDDAANYATIGAKVGYYISLTLNDKGGRFDAQGRARSWWSAADKAGFDGAAAPLAPQYGAYQPLPGLALNGQLTLGSNVADLAGVQAAYDAWHASVKASLKAPPSDLKAADQRFFSAYARGLRARYSEPALRDLVEESPVPPSMYRVAALRNLDAWQAAYDVAPGQGWYLAPAQRVRVW